MKRTLSMLTLAVLTVGLLGSCSKINERLDGLDKRIDGLENERIASIESQIGSINSSITDLGTIRDNIKTLTNTTESQGKDITDLQAAGKALDERIGNLQKYVDDTLAACATTEWVKATFATLEQYKATCDTIAMMDAKLSETSEQLSKDIKACSDSLTKWINKTFEGYYTAAKMDAELAKLKAAIDTASGVSEKTTDSLKTELKKAKADIDTAKAQITRQYTSAITTAITTSEGKLTKALQDTIATVNGRIDALAKKVADLESDVNDLLGRVGKLEGMIQTVTIIPAYGDGTLKVEGDSLYLDCIVTPASAVKNLDTANFTILVKGVVKTKAGVESIKIKSHEDLAIDKVRGIVSIKVKIADKLPGIDSTLAVALNVKDTCNGSDFTTEFVTIEDGRVKDYYVSEGGSGSKSGKDKDNLMDTAALKALLTKWEGRISAQVATLNGVTIHLGEGSYDFGELVTMDYDGQKVKIAFEGVDTTKTVITGNKEHRLFVIGSGVSVSFEKIAFRNSRSYISTYPGILLEEGTESKFTKCLIADNVNEDADPTVGHHSQAGIKTYGKSYFENCKFANNKASYGASLTLDADATVKDCKFIGNRGIHGPGNSLYVDANCTVNVEDCSFKDNRTELMDGGAVAVSTGRLNMTNCYFFGNSNDGWRGGALYAWNNAKVTLTDCTMTRDTSNFGGAIFTQDNSELEIVGGEFSQNYAKGGGFLYQGGNSKVTIKGEARIESNYATEGHGSAVVMGSDEGFLKCESVTFKGNENNSCGGNVAYGGAVGTTGKGMITIKDCTFQENFSKSFGGAAINMTGSGNGLISGCTFKWNHIQGVGITESNDNGRHGGGAIRFDSTGDISVDSCTFESNFFNPNDTPNGYNHAYGGAVYINAGGKYKFNGCKFKGNHAVRGGAFCAWATGASIYLNACSFDGNFITFRYGTTIHIEKAKEFCMNNCSINDNTYTSATQDWQAAWVNLAEINDICLSNCSFIGSPRIDQNTSTRNNSIVRFVDIIGGKHYFVNNIVVTEGAATCNRAFSNYNTSDNYAYYTKRSDNNASGAGGTYTMIEVPGSNGFAKNMFGGLTWNSTDMCWKWNGNMTGGNNTDKADAVKAVEYIGKIEGFKTWLEQIGALYKDQLGNPRPTSGEWWPGAYQGQ